MTADCFVARGAESFVTQDTDYSVAGGTEGSVTGGIEYFGVTFLVGSVYCHPSPLHALSHSYKWSNVVPMNNSP